MPEKMIPTVSIVMPAFKGNFFEAALASILNQTFRDFELIIVDDCSPFDFKSVIERTNDSRISYHRNDSNIGGKNLSLAYRHAYSYATGKYIVIASDDDIYHKDYLEEMIGLADAHPDVSLFSCRVGHINEFGHLVSPGNPVLNKESALYFIWQHECFNSHQTLFEFFMRKSSLDAVGGIAESPLGWFSDVQTWYSLVAHDAGGIVYSQRMLGMFRDSSVQVSVASRGCDQKCTATLSFYRWFSKFSSQTLKPLATSDEDISAYCALDIGYPIRAKKLLAQLIQNSSDIVTAMNIARQSYKSGYMSRKKAVLSIAQNVLRRIRK